MTDRIMEWLDESQRLADQADEGPWEAYGRGGYGRPRVQSVKSLGGGGVIAHTGYGEDDERAGLDAEFIAGSRTRFPQAVAALRAVLDLHHRATDFFAKDDFCAECSSFHRTVEWPCPTLQAITDALGVEGGDDDQ